MPKESGYEDPARKSEGRGDEDYDTKKDIQKNEPPPAVNERSIVHGSSKLEKAEAGLGWQRLKQEKQVTKWRKSLFGKMLALVVCVEIISVLLLTCYVIYTILSHKDLDTTFLSVWFVSNVAQVIGILAVITNHLFPDRGRTEKNR